MNKHSEQAQASEMKISMLTFVDTYSSSGVKWTGSSVNSGGKLAKSRSESSLGLNGGVTCLDSS